MPMFPMFFFMVEVKTEDVSIATHHATEIFAGAWPPPPFLFFLTKLRAIAFVYGIFSRIHSRKDGHYVGIWESSGCMIVRMIRTGGSNCRADSIGDDNVRTMFSKMVKECGLKIDYGRKYAERFKKLQVQYY